MKKTISILGSTGSIGLSSLKILDKQKYNFRIKLLSANQNFSLICKQIKKYRPNFFVISDIKIFNKVKKKYKKNTIIIFNNFELFKIKKKIDITISAIPGIAGLSPTLSLIKLSKKFLLQIKNRLYVDGI